jgi:hypothetical protein
MLKQRTTTQKLNLFKQAFRGRGDVYGTRNLQTGKGLCVKKSLREITFINHFRGNQPLGIYPLVGDRSWFAAIDLDDRDPEPVFELVRLAEGLGLQPLVEVSKSKGFHLWFFADNPGWHAVYIRRVLHWMCAEINKPNTEVFPKQDRLGSGSFGNYIYVPFDGKLVAQERTIFVEPNRWLTPIRDHWGVLENRPLISDQQLVHVIEDLGIPSGGNPSSPSSPTTKPRDQTFANFGLPPCARRMLAEGVKEQQRVACFRLAVHLHRLGIPEDLAKTLLIDWSIKNRPVRGKRIITADEITQQTRDAYSGRYRGYGCEDPAVAQYCQGKCPIAARSRSKTTHQSATNRTVRPLQ